MLSQRTLRRKLQKKAKRKPYRKCPQCGSRMTYTLKEDDHAPPTGKGWRLFKHCGGRIGFDCSTSATMISDKTGCGYWEELFWLGGGTGRHIPHGKPAGERP